MERCPIAIPLPLATAFELLGSLAVGPARLREFKFRGFCIRSYQTFFFLAIFRPRADTLKVGMYGLGAAPRIQFVVFPILGIDP